MCVFEHSGSKDRPQQAIRESAPAAAGGPAPAASVPPPELPSVRPAVPQLAGLEAALLDSEDLKNALAAWAEELDSKSPYSKGHSDEVAAFAVGLSGDEDFTP